MKAQKQRRRGAEKLSVPPCHALLNDSPCRCTSLQSAAAQAALLGDFEASKASVEAEKAALEKQLAQQEIALEDARAEHDATVKAFFFLTHM